MLGSSEGWSAMQEFANQVMDEKEKEVADPGQRQQELARADTPEMRPMDLEEALLEEEKGPSDKENMVPERKREPEDSENPEKEGSAKENA